MKGDPGCLECRGLGYLAINGEAEACVMGRSPANAEFRRMVDAIAALQEDHGREIKEWIRRAWKQSAEAEQRIEDLIQENRCLRAALHAQTRQRFTQREQQNAPA